MKYRPLLIALVLLCAVGCGSKPTMTIRGTAPAECEGLNVYLVPQPFPKAEEVDSTVVRDGKFEFQVDASQVRICDITISRKSPVPFQRLLVAIEQGELEVEIDEYSNGRGTPLNDDLAAWKRALSEAGTRADELRAQILVEDDQAVIDSLKQEMEQGYTVAGLRTVEIIERNLNPMGGFVYQSIERMLDEATRQRLIDLGIEEWKPKRE